MMIDHKDTMDTKEKAFSQRRSTVVSLVSFVVNVLLY